MSAITQQNLRTIAYHLALVRPIPPGATSPMGLYASADQYPLALEVWTRTRNSVADALASTNPRFKRDLFNRATEADRKETRYHGD